jgi:Icc-related predicted phosphoesterase
MKNPFRFLYITDLHGWTNAYEKIFQIAQGEGMTVIINGGDMLPHAKDLIFTQRLFIEEYLSSYFERLDSYGISYYGMLANDDCKAVLPCWQKLVASYSNLYDLTDGWMGVGENMSISGCNYIPDPPFRLKDWCVLDKRDYVRPPQHPNPIISEDGSFKEIEDIDNFFRDRPTLEELLNGIEGRKDSFENAIFVCHAPPYGVGLGNVDKNLDVGSKAVMAWIEKNQPLLTLHGHVHESYLMTGIDTVKIGRTTAHQPGQEGFMGRLIYSTIDIQGDKVLIKRRTVSL